MYLLSRIGPLLLAVLCADAGRAQCFNVDFGNGFGSPSAAYGAAAGQVGHWNEIQAVMGGVYPLLDVGGNATGATLITSWPPNSGLGTAFQDNGPVGDDEALLDDFVQLGAYAGYPAFQIRFTGLEQGKYVVYAYGFSPPRGLGGNSCFVDLKRGQLSFLNHTVGNADWTGQHVLGETYLVDSAGTGNELRLRVTNAFADGRCNGLQLVRIDDCGQLFQRYCEQGLVNGCEPIVVAAGRPSVSHAADFDVVGLGTAPLENGLFFFSTNGRQSVPWWGATNLCVVPPVQRTTALKSGAWAGTCWGYYDLDFAEWMANHPAKAPQAGDVVQMQLWTRDPANASAIPQLLDAVEFTVEP
jgi:hypothetical protein